MVPAFNGALLKRAHPWKTTAGINQI